MDETVDIVGAIYDAGLAPERWQAVLGRLAGHVGAGRAMMGYSDSDVESGGVFTFHEIDTDFFLARWIGEYGAYDPWSHNGFHLDEGSVHTGAELVPLDELRRSPLYHDVLNPLGIEDCLCSFTAKSGPRMGWVNLYHDRQQGPFQPAQVERMRVFAPHLQRAVRIHALLHRHDLAAATWRATIERLPFGVVACDARGWIFEHNSAADELFRSGAVVRSRGGRLRGARSEDDRALSAALLAAAATSVGEGSRGGRQLALGTAGLSWLHALATPLRGEGVAQGLGLLHGGPQVVVFLTRPDRESQLSAEVLAALFGVTLAEAKLTVALCQGVALRDYSEGAGISEHTARNQLKAAMQKVGAKRQSDLVRLVLTSVATLDAVGGAV